MSEGVMSGQITPKETTLHPPRMLSFAVAGSVAFSPNAGAAPRHARPAASRPLVQMQVETPERTQSVADMSAAMKDMRRQIEADEQTSALISAMRGSNINDDDAAASDTVLQVVEMRGGSDSLPTVYDPEALQAYFNQRPGAVLTRVAQLVAVGGATLRGLGQSGQHRRRLEISTTEGKVV